jgi:signal transduction histidine kinase
VTHTDRHPDIEITVRNGETPGTVRIEIADNGPGIPDAEWDIVTESTETPLEHASGIGLWILYWSVTALGGTVERAENEPRGTVLTLDIPTADESR